MATTEPNTADLRRLRRVVCGCGKIGWAMAFLLPQSPHFSSRNFCFAKHTLIVGIRLELERYTALISGRFKGPRLATALDLWLAARRSFQCAGPDSAPNAESSPGA